ncbi:hypothetical protein BKA93DRAFT_779682, partial [Sparassis latifolia]
NILAPQEARAYFQPDSLTFSLKVAGLMHFWCSFVSARAQSIRAISEKLQRFSGTHSHQISSKNTCKLGIEIKSRAQ